MTILCYKSILIMYNKIERLIVLFKLLKKIFRFGLIIVALIVFYLVFVR